MAQPQFQLATTGRGSGSKNQELLLSIFKTLIQSGVPVAKAKKQAFRKVYSTDHDKWWINCRNLFKKPSIQDAVDAMIRDLLEQSGATDQKVAEKLNTLLDSESEDIVLKTARTILEMKGELGARSNSRLKGEIPGELVDFEDIMRKAIKGFPQQIEVHADSDNGQTLVGQDIPA